jgi:hypothetical protein
MQVQLQTQQGQNQPVQTQQGTDLEPPMCDCSVPSSYAFVFVCQRGQLEGLSLLLAASLKRFLTCTYELIAAVPRPIEKWGDLHKETYDLLTQMGVRIEYFENPVPGDRLGDLLTNKIYCFQLPTVMDKLVFLDSDLLCLQPFDGHERFATPVNVAPTFLATGRNWETIYQAVGLPMPTEQIQTLFSNEWQPPYFNSGFVAVERSIARELAQVWLDCFATVSAAGVMDDNLYFREQVCLALAMLKMGVRYDILDQNYNFWVKAHPLDPDHLPYFLHHTWPNPPIYHQPVLIDLVRSLVAEYPTMAPLVGKTRWKYYLRPTWLTTINSQTFKHRSVLKKWLGKSLTDKLIKA